MVQQLMPEEVPNSRSAHEEPMDYTCREASLVKDVQA